jgi:predicted nucleic acid-binding protein
MADKIVLDTSVVLKWYLQHETFADQALLLRKAYFDGSSYIIAPDLLLVEFANILRYQLEMTTDEVKETVHGLLEMGFEWVKLEKNLRDCLRSYEGARRRMSKRVIAI